MNKKKSYLAAPFVISIALYYGGISTCLGQQKNTQLYTLPGCEEILSTGSSNVIIEGKEAARTGDLGRCSAFTLMGSSSVFINGKPAMRVGDKVKCANGKIGSIVGGSSSVMVEGKAMATKGSWIEGCN